MVMLCIETRAIQIDRVKYYFHYTHHALLATVTLFCFGIVVIFICIIIKNREYGARVRVSKPGRGK